MEIHMSTTLMDNINAGLEAARTRLDSLKLNGALLKLEARQRKDEVLADLEKKYATVSERATAAAEATGDKLATAKAALEDAWTAFRARLEETTIDPSSKSA
jgi:ABC-type phosphate transport system auxiliary subunit